MGHCLMMRKGEVHTAPFTVKEVIVAITAANIADYFTVNNGTYYFAGSGSVFTSNNSGKSSSAAFTVLTAKQDISVLAFQRSQVRQVHAESGRDHSGRWRIWRYHEQDVQRQSCQGADSGVHLLKGQFAECQ